MLREDADFEQPERIEITRIPNVGRAIMTHPRRRSEAELLAATLDDTPIIMDPVPGGSNSLTTSIEAWGAYDADTSAHLVIQDDVLPTEHFLEHADRAAQLFPGSAVSFYANWDSMNGAAVRLAVAAGCDWVEAISWDYFPTLATLLPIAVIGEYIEFAKATAAVHFEDDVVLADFLRTRGISAYLSAPSLVQHGALESIAGNAERKAACYHAQPPRKPADQSLIAHSLQVVPFIWRGSAYCVERVGGPSSEGWRYVHWTGAAPRWGLDVEALSAAFHRQFPSTAQARRTEAEFVFSIWIMAYLLGYLPGTDALSVSDVHGGVGCSLGSPDEALVRQALASLAPGGVMESSVDHKFYVEHSTFMDHVVEHGFRLGRSECED